MFAHMSLSINPKDTTDIQSEPGKLKIITTGVENFKEYTGGNRQAT